MEMEKNKPELEDYFIAALRGNLRYYYPELAHDAGYYGVIFLFSAAMLLCRMADGMVLQNK